MGNEEFRRELNSAFDDMSGSPTSNLRDRVRAAVQEAPERRQPYWIAGVAAAVIAVLIVGVLYAGNPLRRGPSTAGAVTSPTPINSSTAAPTPSPSPSPSPSGQPFVCANETIHNPGTVPPPLDYVSDLRTGAHSGYDRLTIEFVNGMPADIKVSVQSGTTFVMGGSGLRTTLKGQNGILIVIQGSDLHTAYSGSLDIVTGYKGLAEVKRVEDYEGVVQLGLGVYGPACYRATVLTNPSRLVIDVQAAG